MDGVILETMVRKGAWGAAETLCRVSIWSKDRGSTSKLSMLT